MKGHDTCRSRTSDFSVSSTGYCHLHDITDRVQDALRNSELRDGIACVAVVGSTAAISTVEYEPGLLKRHPGVLREDIAVRPFVSARRNVARRERFFPLAIVPAKNISYGAVQRWKASVGHVAANRPGGFRQSTASAHRGRAAGGRVNAKGPAENPPGPVGWRSLQAIMLRVRRDRQYQPPVAMPPYGRL